MYAAATEWQGFSAGVRGSGYNKLQSNEDLGQEDYEISVSPALGWFFAAEVSLQAQTSSIKNDSVIRATPIRTAVVWWNTPLDLLGI
jgi:hypothetical protein